MHDLHETMEWYREHDSVKTLGFNPDGRCLQICRTARDLPAVYPSAKESQDATPKEYRVYKVADLRKGMVVYYDDPHDSNVFGHVATLVGRVRGFDPDSLHDVLVKTNSVKSGEIVVVRGDYFEEHWGDRFQFGATWLNGRELDVFKRKEKAGPSGHQAFAESRPDWDLKILGRVADKHPALQAKLHQFDKVVDDLPSDTKDDRVKEFKDAYDKDRVVKLHLLNDVVRDDARFTKVKAVRDELRALIKSVLPR